MDNRIDCNSLPNELVVEIATHLSFYDLVRFESTSKYWHSYFTRSDAWEKHYEAINQCKDISKLPMNFWWQSEELWAKRCSTLLNVNRASRTVNDRTLDYITPPYRYYIRTILDHKPIVRKDLEWIHARSDLSFREKKLAVKLYWLIHMKFPRLNFAIDANECDTWVPKENKHLFPRQFQDLADSKPLFYWDDTDGDNYMRYIWIFWLRSDDSLTMYLAMQHVHRQNLEENQVINFKIEEFAQKDELLFDLPTGDNKDRFRRFSTVQKSIKTLQCREAIYLTMSKELNWKMDLAARTVIESVTQDVKVSSNVKQRCDQWLSGLDPKQSNNSKAAIIRCLRRVLWFLLKKETIQHSQCAQAVYVESRAAWKERYHDNKTDHMSPKHWALYLIEKAYYCVDPLAEVLIQLLRNEDTTKSQRKLAILKIDRELIEKAILLFHTKE